MIGEFGLGELGKNEFIVPIYVCMEDSRIEEGVEIIQSIWYGVGVQIVNLAIKIYGLNKEQAKALKDTYLKPNDFTVRFRD